MPKLNLEPSAESFLKGIKERKAKSEAAISDQEPQKEDLPAQSVAIVAPTVYEEITEPKEKNSVSEIADIAPVTTHPTKKPAKAQKKSAQEALKNYTLRIYPSQMRALKQRSLVVGGPDQDKQISEILRSAIDMYLAKK